MTQTRPTIRVYADDGGSPAIARLTRPWSEPGALARTPPETRVLAAKLMAGELEAGATASECRRRWRSVRRLTGDGVDVELALRPLIRADWLRAGWGAICHGELVAVPPGLCWSLPGVRRVRWRVLAVNPAVRDRTGLSSTATL